MGDDNPTDGENKSEKPAETNTSNTNKRETFAKTAAAVSPSSTTKIHPSGAGTTAGARRPVSNTAEEQVARMSRDISGGTVVDKATLASEAERDTGEKLNFREMITSSSNDEGKSPDEVNEPVADDVGGEDNTPSSTDTDADDQEEKKPQRMTIIAEGTEISGEVKFASKAEVYGTINATVQSIDDIIANTGEITGNVSAKNIDMLDSKIKGDVATAGDIRLNDRSVLTGGVSANRMDLRGQVVGDASVRRELNVHNTARLQGDIEAGSIAIGHGARIKGFLNIEGVDDGSGAVIGSQAEAPTSKVGKTAASKKK